MPQVLIFATHNQHKLEEVQALMASTYTVKSLMDIHFLEDIPETGKTFQENASIKSHFIYEKFQINCFADDSGLEIDALQGAPGVYTARYSGSRDAEKNLQLVLSQLDGISNRKARFRSVISLIINGKEHLFEGVVEGYITLEKSGSSGFGYDPIFVPRGYQETFADMPMAIKNKISHRFEAVKKLTNFLKIYFPNKHG